MSIKIMTKSAGGGEVGGARRCTVLGSEPRVVAIDRWVSGEDVVRRPVLVVAMDLIAVARGWVLQYGSPGKGAACVALRCRGCFHKPCSPMFNPAPGTIRNGQWWAMQIAPPVQQARGLRHECKAGRRGLKCGESMFVPPASVAAERR